MKFISTRDTKGDTLVSSAFAIKQGLAPDGGLYVPEYIPTIDKDFVTSLLKLSYPEKAAKILSLYLDDFTSEELLDYANAAYTNGVFPPEVAPLASVDNKLSVLELWHGPTAAFKDFALCIMPHLLTASLKKLGETRTAMILVATSGDTGSAVGSAFHNVPGLDVTILYPEGKISPLQEKQLSTFTGNVRALKVKGTFDDCQRLVKTAFTDASLREKLRLSSANSINISRLLPQSFYYMYAALLVRNRAAMDNKIHDPSIIMVVPSGNFGNLTSGLIAREMGAKIDNIHIMNK